MTTITTEVVADKVKRTQGGHRITPPEKIAELIQAYEDSGLSMMAFSKREGLCYQTFVTWVRGRSKQQVAASAPRFAQIRLSTNRHSDAGLSVTLPDGVVLRGDDPVALAALVRGIIARS